MSRYFIVLSLVLTSIALMAERQPYSRYESIVTRQMFGPLPPGFDPTKSPEEVKKSGQKSEEALTKEQEQVKKAIRFSVINVTPNGETAVGFTDSQDPKAPCHYYLKVGEQRGGWIVKAADADEKTMTIENRDGVEVTLSLGADSAKSADAVKNGAAARASSARPGLLGGRSAIGGNLLGTSLRSRRAFRDKQAEEAAAEAQAKAEALEAERAEEKARAEEKDARHEAQLAAISEELRRAREARDALKAKQEESSAEDGSEN